MHQSQYLTTIESDITQRLEVCEIALSLFPEGHAAAVRPLAQVGQALGRILAPHTARQMQAIEQRFGAHITPKQAGTLYAVLFLHPDVVRVACEQVARLIPQFAQMSGLQQVTEEYPAEQRGTVDHMVHLSQAIRQLRIDQVLDLSLSVLEVAAAEVDHLLGITEGLTGGEIRAIVFTMVPTMLEFYVRFSVQNAESLAVIADAVTSLQKQAKAKAEANGRAKAGVH